MMALLIGTGKKSTKNLPGSPIIKAVANKGPF
jgi:hypothetical protein